MVVADSHTVRRMNSDSRHCKISPRSSDARHLNGSVDNESRFAMGSPPDSAAVLLLLRNRIPPLTTSLTPSLVAMQMELKALGIIHGDRLQHDFKLDFGFENRRLTDVAHGSTATAHIAALHIYRG